MTRCSLYITVAAAICSEIYKSFSGVCTHIESTFLPPPLSPPTESILSQGKTVEMVTAPTQGETWLLPMMIQIPSLATGDAYPRVPSLSGF